MIQALPDADETTLSLVEARLLALPPTTSLLREGLGPVHILERIFDGIPFNVTGETDLFFRCSCSRSQVERMLRSLGAEELRNLREREEKTSVTCEFCRASYHFSSEDLEAISR
jgi:molecular chaperone Hsp33